MAEPKFDNFGAFAAGIAKDLMARLRLEAAWFWGVPRLKTRPPEIEAKKEGGPSKAEEGELPGPGQAPSELPWDLPALASLVASCKKCRLASGRRNTVFGEGPLGAIVMFVGEGPGAEEDAAGRPFVGPAGQLLDRMIRAMKLRREECYIGNVVKCRPPRNAVPLPDEVAACLPYLKRQIEIVRPKFIVALGRTAALALTGRPDAVSRLRGIWFSYTLSQSGQKDEKSQEWNRSRGDIPILVTYHPAALLRNPALKPEAWKDLQLVMARIAALGTK